jgi:hypothetical protein
MNKCPHCRASVGALDRYCESCGGEILIKGNEKENSTNTNSSAELVDAKSLCAKIEQDLAALTLQPPTSKIRAIIVGLLIPPTLGLILIVHKALQVFGKQGESASRLELSINENLRKAKTGYSNDPTVSSLIKRSQDELNTRFAKKHSSRLILISSALISLMIILALYVSSNHTKNKLIEKQLANLSKTVEKIQTGDIVGALAILNNLTAEERDLLASKDPIVLIPLDLIKGHDEEALALTQKITDQDSRLKALSFIAEKIYIKSVQEGNYDKASTIASYIIPESKRINSIDNVYLIKAKIAINSDKMDEAKKIISNIRDQSKQNELNELIKAKLPKAELNGF